MFGSSNKNGKSNGNVIESYGKTEPVTGGAYNFGGFTEPVNSGGPVSLGKIPPTAPATSGIIEIDSVIPNGPGSGNLLENYRPTEPGGLIFTEASGEQLQPVVGWLVCIKGANKGKEYRIHSDYNYVGSASGDIIITGDPKISREKHMLVTYDPETRKFYVAPASGANIVRLNDKGLVGGAEELKNYDVIRTGDTSLMFISFCGPDFSWEDLHV